MVILLLTDETPDDNHPYGSIWNGMTVICPGISPSFRGVRVVFDTVLIRKMPYKSVLVKSS